MKIQSTLTVRGLLSIGRDTKRGTPRVRVQTELELLNQADVDHAGGEMVGTIEISLFDPTLIDKIRIGQKLRITIDDEGGVL